MVHFLCFSEFGVHFGQLCVWYKHVCFFHCPHKTIRDFCWRTKFLCFFFSKWVVFFLINEDLSQLITLPWFITSNNKDCPSGVSSQFFLIIIMIQRLGRRVTIFQRIQRHQDYVISLVFFQQSFMCCLWRKWTGFTMM